MSETVLATLPQTTTMTLTLNCFVHHPDCGFSKVDCEGDIDDIRKSIYGDNKDVFRRNGIGKFDLIPYLVSCHSFAPDGLF